MHNYTNYFKDKKITVMGLGLLGRGVGDVAFLAECGAEVIVTDLKSEEELSASLEKLRGFSNITFVFGEHRMEDFEEKDMILVAAGVPMDSPYVAQGRKESARIAQSAALFAELSQIPIIGVTGTRGKSTVAHMIHHVLTHVTGGHIILGGNIRGVSNLQLLKEVHEDSLAVMELDSWQLQGFGWAKISPQIAVFTNFLPDHMNYYVKGDPGTTASPDSAEYRAGMDAYFADKANIFLYQKENDVFITTPEVFELIQNKSSPRVPLGLEREVVLVDASVIPDDTLLSMPGEHNRQNAALAYEALKTVSLSDEEIFEGLASFKGVPGRLEYLREIGRVKIYNDNNATTPEATVAGIRALAGDKNVVLIAGGTDKDLDLTPLITAIKEHCKKVVLLPGTGTEKLLESLTREGNSTINRTIHKEVDSLEEAVKAGLACGEPGDILLFSPAFASFGMFKNEYDRNDQFIKIISQYE